jgi:type V secretory pathway adhesin AidA
MNTPTNSEALPLTPCSASWLPISTAPNSLNVILVTNGESVWTDQKLGGYSGTLPGNYYFNGHDNWEEVTHWMPIPSLPNAKGMTGIE